MFESRYLKTTLGAHFEKTVQYKAMKLCRHVLMNRYSSYVEMGNISQYPIIISERKYTFKILAYKNCRDSSEENVCKVSGLYIEWFSKKVYPQLSSILMVLYS